MGNDIDSNIEYVSESESGTAFLFADINTIK